MRSLLVAAAILAAGAAGAGLGSGVRADAYEADGVAYARRGALGGDAYVVTNVAVRSPCYALATGCGTSLVDRAVNACSVTGDVAFAAPPKPAVRESDGRRDARAFVLVLDVAADAAPEVSFHGFGALATVEGEGIEIEAGRTLLSFFEIGDGEFVVDVRRISRLGGQ